jgi:hypothetical protein
VTSGRAPARRARAWFRGLALGLTLSILNLLGAFLTLLALGGLGSWSGTQFIGLVGLLEIATGVMFIIGPNVWRLPVAAAKLEPGTPIRFAASTILIPHWAGGVKSVAGLVFLTWAAVRVGVGWNTATIAVVLLDVCIVAMALSMIVARAGCARPDLDVFQISLSRPGRAPTVLPGMSAGAALVQALLNVLTFPLVKLLDPSALYSPELSPSPQLLGWLSAAALVTAGVAIAAWADRFTWQAARPQQREAERAFPDQ